MNTDIHTHGHHPMGRVPTVLKAALGIFIPVLMVAAPVPVAHAATTNLYVSPGSANVAQNATLSVAVRLNTGGEPINAVQADLSYNAAQLEFTGISANGSAFGVTAPSTGGNGKVSIARGNIDNVTGDVLVATISFKAIAASVSTDVTFDNSSQAVRSTDNINVLDSKTNGKYALTAVASTPPPAGPSPKTPSPAASGAKTPAPGPAPATPTPSGTPPATPGETPDTTDGTAETPSPAPAGPTTKPSFTPPDSINESSVGAKIAFWSVSGLAVVAVAALIWRSMLRRRHPVMPAVVGGAGAGMGTAPFGPPPSNMTITPQTPLQSPVLPASPTMTATPEPTFQMPQGAVTDQPGVVSPQQAQPSTELSLPGVTPAALPPAVPPPEPTDFTLPPGNPPPR